MKLLVSTPDGVTYLLSVGRFYTVSDRYLVYRDVTDDFVLVVDLLNKSVRFLDYTVMSVYKNCTVVV
jgi:hypothetical protein